MTRGSSGNTPSGDTSPLVPGVPGAAGGGAPGAMGNAVENAVKNTRGNEVKNAVDEVGSAVEGIERIGVFGGTFDPPHVGHIAAAEATLAALQLDRVLFVVSNVPWQKVDDGKVTNAADRLALVRAAVSRTEEFEVSGAEIDRGGDSFTAETLEELAAPGRKLYLILGSDLAPGLNTWKSPEVIRSLATVAVVGRLGDRSAAVPPPGWDWVPVRGPGIEVSSSEIRRWLMEGRPLGAVLTAGVVEEIRRRGLYRSLSCSDVTDANG